MQQHRKWRVIHRVWNKDNALDNAIDWVRSAESRIKLHITGTRCTPGTGTQVYKNMYPNESLIEHVINNQDS